MKFLLLSTLIFVSCGTNPGKEGQNREQNITLTKGEIEDTLPKKITPPSIKGYWSCKNTGGQTIIKSLDSVKLEISSNQIWILTSLKEKKDSNAVFYIYLVKPLDLGRGGMNLDWDNFSKSVPIGRLLKINDSMIIKKWYGFYNRTNAKYEDQWAYDWDACDTIYLKNNNN